MSNIEVSHLVNAVDVAIAQTSDELATATRFSTGSLDHNRKLDVLIRALDGLRIARQNLIEAMTL